MRKKVMTVLGVCALGLMMALPAGAQVGREPAGSGDAGCFYVVLTSVESPGMSSRPARFEAKKTTDILLNTVFPEPLKGEHLLTLKLYTPHGYLYRQIDVPVAADTGRAPEGRKVEHYPYPLKQKFPEMRKINDEKVQAVTLNLPVAGSNIMTSSLYGRWKVEVFLDGERPPCRVQETIFYISE